MKIGIIGSGNVGSTLAGHLSKVGHQVSIANSRGPATLATIASETGAAAATLEEATQGQDVVIIAIPEKAIAQLPHRLISGGSTVVVDAGNYYPSRDGSIQPIDSGLTESEWVEQVLGCTVVKAFNNIIAGSLARLPLPTGSPKRICLSVAGNDQRSKELVLELIDSIGFDGIDAGPLSESWRQQPGAPAYCRDLERDKLEAALSKADSILIATYRAEADEIARPYFTA